MRQQLVAAVLLCMLLVPAAVGIESGGDSSVAITRPRNGVYLFDLRVLPLAGQIVVGPVTVEVTASQDIDRVSFVVPPKVGCRPREVGSDDDAPFGFVWRGSSDAIQDTGLATLIAQGYNGTDRVAEDTIMLLRFAS